MAYAVSIVDIPSIVSRAAVEDVLDTRTINQTSLQQSDSTMHGFSIFSIYDLRRRGYIKHS